MTRKIFIVLSLLGITFLSCNQKYISRTKAERIAAEYLYYSKDGYSFLMTPEEAEKKGISPEDYSDFHKLTREANEMMKSYMEMIRKEWGDSVVDTLTIDFFFPKDKVIKEGLDPRIKIIDTDKTDDMGEQYSQRNKALGYIKVETDINGGAGKKYGWMPYGTRKIAYSAYTSCPFGFFAGYFIANGKKQSFGGNGLKPASGAFIPGPTPGQCEAYIKGSGCYANATAFFKDR